jgi:hypothetical protein
VFSFRVDKRKRQHVATFSNCGNTLTAFATTFIWRQVKGTRLMVEPNGKNAKDWAIRREASFITLLHLSIADKVGRFNWQRQ